MDGLTTHHVSVICRPPACPWRVRAAFVVRAPRAEGDGDPLPDRCPDAQDDDRKRGDDAADLPRVQPRSSRGTPAMDNTGLRSRRLPGRRCEPGRRHVATASAAYGEDDGTHAVLSRRRSECGTGSAQEVGIDPLHLRFCTHKKLFGLSSQLSKLAGMPWNAVAEAATNSAAVSGGAACARITLPPSRPRGGGVTKLRRTPRPWTDNDALTFRRPDG